MMYWAGVVMFAIGAWLVYRAFAQKSRALQIQAEIAASNGRLAAPELHPSLKTVGTFFPTLMIWFLVYAGLKGTLGWYALDGGRVLSFFDVAGFLFLLTGYGTWLTLTTRYRIVRPVVVAQAEPAMAVEEGRADVVGPDRAAGGIVDLRPRDGVRDLAAARAEEAVPDPGPAPGAQRKTA